MLFAHLRRPMLLKLTKSIFCFLVQFDSPPLYRLFDTSMLNGKSTASNDDPSYTKSLVAMDDVEAPEADVNRQRESGLNLNLERDDEDDGTLEDESMHDKMIVNSSDNTRIRNSRSEVEYSRSETPEDAAGKERIKIIFKRKASGEEHPVNVTAGPPSKKQSANGGYTAFSRSEESSKEAKLGQLSAVARVTRSREKQVSEPCLQADGGAFISRKNRMAVKKCRSESQCPSFIVGLTSSAKDTLSKNVESASSVMDYSGATVGTSDSGAPDHSCQQSENEETVCEYGTEQDNAFTVSDELQFTLAVDRDGVPSDDQGINLEKELAASMNESSDVDVHPRPKARRTPLALTSQEPPVVDGAAQVMHTSPMTGSPVGNSVILPATRSPLPFPLNRSPLPVPRQSHVSSAESSGDGCSLIRNSIDQRSGHSNVAPSVQTTLQYSSSCQSTSTMLEIASTVSGVQRLENEVDTQSMGRDSDVWKSLGYVLGDVKQETEFTHPDRDVGVIRRVEHGCNLLKVNQPPKESELAQIAQARSTLPSGQLKHLVYPPPGEDTSPADASSLPLSNALGTHLSTFSFQKLFKVDTTDLEDCDGELVTDEPGEDMENEEEVSNIYSAEWDVLDQPLEQTHEHEADMSERCVSQQSDDMYHGQGELSSEMLLGQRERFYSSRKLSVPKQDHNCSHACDIDSEIGTDSSNQPSMSEGSASPSDPQVSGGTPCSQSHSLDGGQMSSDASKDLYIAPKQLKPFGGIRLKIKMSEVTLKEVPRTAKTLLATGLLEGYPVRYLDRARKVILTGVVQRDGILCDCEMCEGRTIVNVSGFEKHAGSNARHPSDNIFLENGKSLHHILEAGWLAPKGKVLEALRTAIEGIGDNGECGKRVLSESGGGLVRCNRENSINTSHSGSYQQKLEPNFTKSGQTPRLTQTSKHMSLHKLIFLPRGLPDGTELSYYIKGQCMLDGVKKGSGICCSCCDQVVSCSQFEAHAGWGSRRNPYNSIYLADGRSLHDVALELAAHTSKAPSSNALRENDDFCAECGDGGDLVLCDGCPRAYHTECAGLVSIPDGDWFCLHCEDEVGNEQNVLTKRSARCGGKLSGVASTEIFTGRCQRIVKVSENSLGGCVICRNGDFQKSGFGARTIMLCDQCEREFHVGCMKENGLADLKVLPEGKWFCSMDCEHIHNVLQVLVLKGPELVHSSILKNVLEMQQRKNSQEQVKVNTEELTWQLLHGRRGDPENGRTLSEAATIFGESFKAIVDGPSRRDLISLMLYSRTVRDLDFGRMYCAVLKCNGTVVSAAIIRIFGRQFTEMPLVATSALCRGQGYFQMLLLSIERLLGMLQVQHLILPAAEGGEDIWTNKFGFSKMHDDQVQRFISQVQVMTFEGSSMMLKDIPKQPAITLSRSR